MKMIKYQMAKKEQIKSNKFSDYYKELFTVALLVLSYVINVSLLTLVAFGLACVIVVFSNYQKSSYALAFFTSFSILFSYSGKHMFFVMAALFILKSLVSNKISLTTFLFYLAIFVYSIMFSDFQGEISFASLIGLILIFVIPLMAYASDKIDCNTFMRHYILGFVISTVIGFFVKEIPSMYQLFDVDLLWTDDYQELTRFFGLAFDANFYALSNYVIIAYLLFAFEKTTPFRGVIALFLFLAGVMTISKSYFLVVGVLLVFYVIKNISHFKYLILFLVIAVLGVWMLSVASEQLGYNAVDMVISRFTKGGSLADNTTGRTEIWKSYFDLFDESGIKEVLFGFGFNATVELAAHNTLIEFAYYYGMVGLILWGLYFIHCWTLFGSRTKLFGNKSPMVCICFIVGAFFLSAYTYESFWIGIVISLMTLGSRRKTGDCNV